MFFDLGTAEALRLLFLFLSIQDDADITASRSGMGRTLIDILTDSTDVHAGDELFTAEAVNSDVCEGRIQLAIDFVLDEGCHLFGTSVVSFGDDDDLIDFDCGVDELQFLRDVHTDGGDREIVGVLIGISEDESDTDIGLLDNAGLVVGAGDTVEGATHSAFIEGCLDSVKIFLTGYVEMARSVETTQQFKEVFGFDRSSTGGGVGGSVRICGDFAGGTAFAVANGGFVSHDLTPSVVWVCFGYTYSTF